MLSAMTTSENFPLNSRCAAATYRSYLTTPTAMRSVDDDVRSSDYQQWTRIKCAAAATVEDVDVKGGEFEVQPGIICNSISVSGGGLVESEAPKPEIEPDLLELLDHLELDDVSYDQSKPLRIDPNVFKLDFSNLSNHDRTKVNDYKPLDEFCSENRRASHHLSGGGLIMDDDYICSKTRGCQSSGGCLISNKENVFNFNVPNDFRASGFFNQISPSSPLTFDLTPRSEVKNVTNRISDVESTNPFRNSMKDVLEDETNGFPRTNPFGDFSSSLSYENVSPPQKSQSQCSTRPASPVSRVPEESSISNPFLINRTSPEPRPAISLPPFFINNDGNFQNSSNSVIFAVPVFPIFPHNITNSSTQTTTSTTTTTEVTESTKATEPVYQNITNQLRKFMQRNDHSEYDLQCLKTTVKDLRNSGWYYENVSWQESVVLLKNTEPGTFLIRDSSDPNFLFSLSVQTSRGPTSVRLHYVNGQFRLDAEEKLIPHMPSFNSVVELIDYYIENTVKNKFTNRLKKSAKKNGKSKLQKSKEQVWIDSQGNIYSNILLVRPLYKKEHFSTLQHLVRLTINKHLKKQMNTKVKTNFRVTPVYESSPFQDCSFPNRFDHFCPVLSMDSLPLPTSLIEYLKDYPYCH